MTDTSMSIYSTAQPFVKTKPPWIRDTQEQLRIGAYALYESIYNNNTKTFSLIGEDERTIYIPSGRVIVETMNRYVAPGLQVVPDPAYGSDQEKLLATQVWTDFARRERFYSRFNSNKRYGIMRGDWAFHLYADPLRTETTRISCFGIDPASLFPIYNPENIDEIIGWHIVDNYLNDQGDSVIRRTTYRKTTGKGGPSPITVEDGLYDPEEWGGPDMKEEDVKLLQVIMPVTTLPEPIDHLPVYHIPNRDMPGQIWGKSEMQGLEVVMRAISQGASDEDLTLAMDGLGVWVTDSGTPVNDEGEEEEWNMGPGRVVEIQTGRTFNRANANNSVTPYQDHLGYLHDQIDEAEGFSAISKGKVDVGVAESGVALALELSSILSSSGEKDQLVTDALTNLLFDLPKWYIAYEGTAFRSLMDVTRWIPTYGDKIPRNKAQEITDLTALTGAKIISKSYARQRLRTLGYTDMPEESVIAAEIEGEAMLDQDAFGARVDGEVNQELESGATGDQIE